MNLVRQGDGGTLLLYVNLWTRMNRESFSDEWLKHMWRSRSRSRSWQIHGERAFWALTFTVSEMGNQSRGMKLSNLFFKIIYLFLAVLSLHCCMSLVAVSRGCSPLRCAGFLLQWLALECGCGTQASGALRHVGSSQPGIEPAFPSLADRFLSTGPPGKSYLIYFKSLLCLLQQFFHCLMKALEVFCSLRNAWPQHILVEKELLTLGKCVFGCKLKEFFFMGVCRVSGIWRETKDPISYPREISVDCGTQE